MAHAPNYIIRLRIGLLCVLGRALPSAAKWLGYHFNWPTPTPPNEASQMERAHRFVPFN